jgi:hypothetical protein
MDGLGPAGYLCAGGAPGFTKGYVLYGKEGTLFLNLDERRLLLGLKSEGGQLKEVPIAEDMKESWKVSSEYQERLKLPSACSHPDHVVTIVTSARHTQCTLPGQRQGRILEQIC